MKELEPSMYFLCFPAHLSSSDALLLYYLSFIHALLIPEGHCPFAYKTSLSRTTASPVYRSLTSR